MTTRLPGVATRSLACLCALLLNVSGSMAAGIAHQHAGGMGEDPHAHHRAMLANPPGSEGESTQVKLLDRELVTQDGDRVRFASEVIGDHIAVVDFVYTTCTTVCPVLSAIFEQVQGRLGQRAGHEVYLVSVSVDPNRDTPQRMKAYASRHQAGPGWTWLTGEKQTVDEVLTGLGAYTSNFEEHPSMVLVGDGRSGVWKRFFGFPGPDQILAAVDDLMAARQAAAMLE